MAAKQKQEKPIVVEARYALKRNGHLTGVVCYRIKASTWTPEQPDVYCTTLVNGRASGCTCDRWQKSHRACKHMTFCEALEVERLAQRREAAPLGDNRTFSLVR